MMHLVFMVTLLSIMFPVENDLFERLEALLQLRQLRFLLFQFLLIHASQRHAVGVHPCQSLVSLPPRPNVASKSWAVGPACVAPGSSLKLHFAVGNVMSLSKLRLRKQG